MFWQAQFGLTDDLSIGGGTSLFGLPATLNAKYSFNLSKDFNMAMGYFWIGNLFWGGDDDRTIVSMPFAVVTKGSKENNITFLNKFKILYHFCYFRVWLCSCTG